METLKNELELIERLSRAISNNICGSNIPLDKRPWTAEQCADYLRIGIGTFHNTIAPLPTFPSAIRAQTAKGRGQPRWIAQEVIDWWLSHREATENRRKRKSA